MKDMDETINELRMLSLGYLKPIEKRMNKLAEECGELATEINLLGEPNPKKPRTEQESIDNIKEEAADVFIMAADIMCWMGMSNEEICRLVTAKCDKWRNNYKVKTTS